MLEKIFTSKTRVKTIGFLLFKKEETYIREISNELKIPVSAVKREIDNLYSFGLIIKRERNKIILNKKCPILPDLKNIFIKTDFIVYPIKESLKKTKAEFIFIFGSFARGEYGQDSDVDIMFIGNIKLDKVIKTINPIEDKIKRNINPVVWKMKDLMERKKEGFVRDLFSKKIIMIRGNENELRKIAKG